MSAVEAKTGGGAGSGEIDLGGLWRLIVTRRNWVLGATLLALVGSTAFVNIVKTRYTAETRILLETQDSFTPRLDKTGDYSAATIDAEAVGSQIQLLTSRDVARRAIKSIGLLNNPEFDPMAGGPGVISRMLILAKLKRDPTQLSPEDRVMETYYEKLSVFSPTKTRILTIEFQSHNPDLAAKAANTIADIYLDYQQEAKRNLAHSAAESLGVLVANLKARVAEADEKAENFRLQSGLLVGANNTTINAQQLGEVNTELSRARSSQADAQAKARLIREMLRQGRVGEIPDVANNDLFRRISEQRVNLKAQLALESRTLLSGHPRIKELQAQLADLDVELRMVAERAARTLENDSKIAGSRVENLQAALDQQKKVVGAAGVDEVQMRELDRTARQLKDELEAASAKYKEALSQEKSTSTSADARVVSRALAPQTPTFPKKLPIIGFSTFGAFVFSIGILAAQQLFADPKKQTPSGSPHPSPLRKSESIEGEPVLAVDKDRFSPAFGAVGQDFRAATPVSQTTPRDDVSADAFDQNNSVEDVYAAADASATIVAHDIDDAPVVSHATTPDHARREPLHPELSHPELSHPELLQPELLQREPLQPTVLRLDASASERDNAPENAFEGHADDQAVKSEPLFKPSTDISGTLRRRAQSDVSARARIYASEAILANNDGAGGLSLVVSEGSDDRGFALALGRRLSREGRCILVALDDTTRLPAVYPSGWADLMQGEASFAEAIQRDVASRLHIIGAGQDVDAASDDSYIGRLFATLEALTTTYDFVVVSASQALDIADAEAISHLASHVAVWAIDPQHGQELALALEESGLPQAVLIRNLPERVRSAA